jgi:hypothetical protein
MASLELTLILVPFVVGRSLEQEKRIYSKTLPRDRQIVIESGEFNTTWMLRQKSLQHGSASGIASRHYRDHYGHRESQAGDLGVPEFPVRSCYRAGESSSGMPLLRSA